jgi:hypothetical protein
MQYIRISDHNFHDPIMPRITPTRRRKLLMSYAPDWAITLVLAAAFFSLDLVHGFRRQFSLEDTSYVCSFRPYPFLILQQPALSVSTLSSCSAVIQRA